MSRPDARLALVEAGRQVLNEVVERQYERERLVERLEKSVRAAYDSVIVSPASIASAGGQLDRISDALSDLAEEGVFVFAYLPEEFPAEFRADEDAPPRLEFVREAQPSVETVESRLSTRGLRVGRTLPVVGPQDPFVPILDGIRREIEPEGPRRKLPPAFSTTTRPEDFTQQRFVLPIADEGRGLIGGADALLLVLDSLLLVPRINVSEKAQEIQSESMEILDHFLQVGERADENLQRGRDLVLEEQDRLEGAEKGVFDPRSGAVFFTPHDWRSLTAEGTAVLNMLKGFFSERLPYRQPDRPCFKRILFTPTKVLLRGEQYYVNMRNISPFERLDQMYRELNTLRGVAARIQPHLSFASQDEWKLSLAFLDQFRNIALQLLSFSHAVVPTLNDDLADEFRNVWGGADEGVHGLVRQAIRAFYSCLLMDLDATREAMQEVTRVWNAWDDRLRAATSEAQEETERSERFHTTDNLVRRWREADHPGENLLTTILAADELQETGDLHVVGIGWGGIELPLVFDFVSARLNESQTRSLHISRWSHYRRPEEQVYWDHFPEPHTEDFFLEGDPVVLLDDNTLTGITLEKIRDNLLLRGAGSVSMFVTRYSGERRHAQMKMPGHGAVDPDVLQDEIGGYLGETAFARSWSTERYENPVGVFSLARRRILECIYNNSTVELYEREGF